MRADVGFEFEIAEKMHQEVLELRETVLGKEHRDTLSSINNLAIALDNQGKYEEAEKICRRALSLRQRAVGKEHPDALTSVRNLATILESQGKSMMAEEMYQ